jgi:hypothetical protein
MLNPIYASAGLGFTSEAGTNTMPEIPLPEHKHHTHWVFETEVGPGEDCRDHHFDAEGFDAAMLHAQKLLKEAQYEGQEVLWPRLRPYGINADKTYEVKLV